MAFADISFGDFFLVFLRPCRVPASRRLQSLHRRCTAGTIFLILSASRAHAQAGAADAAHWLDTPGMIALAAVALVSVISLAWAVFRIRSLKTEVKTAARAMRTLAESEKRYRFIIDHSTDVMWQLDRELRISYLSDAIWSLAGYAPKDMIGTSFADLVTAESYRDLDEKLQLLDRHPLPPNADPFKVELEIFRRDQSTVWVEVHATALRAVQGDVVGYFGVTRDVSERKHVELALRGSEAKFRTLLEGAPFAVTILRTEDGLLLYANQRAADQLATPIDDIIGRNASEYFENPATVLEIDRRLRDTGYVSNLQVRLKRMNGEAFWALHSSRLVAFEGTTASFVAFSDISASKRVEADLLQANDLLRQNLEEISHLQAQLREQAVRDALTGLFNRRYLDETLDRELARAKREQSALALVMINVDHFKQVNDTYGHPAGDEVLKSLAQMLTHNTRTEDIVCRYGGEEFLIMLPKATAEVAHARAEQWRQIFEASAVTVDRRTIRATISLGVAAYPENAIDVAELSNLTDEALYTAKKTGRNKVIISSSSRRDATA